MLLATFTSRRPANDSGAVGALVGLATAALHCVFVGWPG
ncbi:hypothetical protein NAEX_05311 [Nannocystis exedens]|nr:hypothetical protein NAEX_05311 [Nannocystis exedens]